MPSVECFRQFFNQRLTAAAEEIFREFEKTMVEYEEEIIRQRKLLAACLKPEVKLHRIEQRQQHVYMEKEVLPDQELCNRENSDSLKQEEPDPPQIKEEQEEVGTIQDRQELVLKQETNNVMLTSTYEEGEHSEDQTVCFNTVKVSDVPEPTDHQVLHHPSENGDSVSEQQTNKKPKPQRTLRSRSTVPQYTASKIPTNYQKGEKSFICDICGKMFKESYKLKRHRIIHTGEKPFSCKFCDKTFRDGFDLRKHTSRHTTKNNIIVASVEDFMRFDEIS